MNPSTNEASTYIRRHSLSRTESSLPKNTDKHLCLATRHLPVQLLDIGYNSQHHNTFAHPQMIYNTLIEAYRHVDFPPPTSHSLSPQSGLVLSQAVIPHLIPRN
ncbi:hypothetical protein FOIG_09391 [Fusarium odoratissimum NRRL 54006]|uniref:Uncharacterized protein n=2 Tax=Fusarium oxysporum species complex TaxID=171631 RepID=X0KPA6_FUSO5|nr:uncharacterized protein FOIG_09391 [Fusarium odoratissimum NRRL 54006]EXL98644.1 hypothetical protein FOIG_09391 [Fusarium odoratissimum NRRL 54006]TXC01980.1 hypothetical protein FocTR4_00008112 [Fusarium oxysporum f. sp. cubense]